MNPLLHAGVLLALWLALAWLPSDSVAFWLIVALAGLVEAVFCVRYLHFRQRL